MLKYYYLAMSATIIPSDKKSNPQLGIEFTDLIGNSLDIERAVSCSMVLDNYIYIDKEQEKNVRRNAVIRMITKSLRERY
jgi:hypothetical protein